MRMSDINYAAGENDCQQKRMCVFSIIQLVVIVKNSNVRIENSKNNKIMKLAGVGVEMS